MSKLISQGGYGCVYHPGFDVKDSSKLDKNNVVKLQHKSAVSSNEIEVSKLVMTIPHFIFYFAPILKTESIEIGEIEKTLVKSCKPVAKNMNSDFVLMTVPYINQESYFESLVNVDTNDTRTILTQYIDSYTFLLSSIEFLIKKKIVHCDIKDDNIVYSRINRNPIIIDFGISIPMEKVDSTSWHKYFYVFAPEYYVWCLEIHFINFLIHEKDTLEEEDISMICNNYINYCPIFSLFTREFKDKYKEGAIGYYKQYMDTEKETAIQQLMTTWETWDNYSLSILTLRVVSYMFEQNYYDNVTIGYILQIYTQNIHYDGNRRYSIKETKKLCKEIYSQESSVESLYFLLDKIKPKRKTVKEMIHRDKIDRTSYSNLGKG
jgi:serine/threonine protein kinase